MISEKLSRRRILRNATAYRLSVIPPLSVILNEVKNPLRYIVKQTNKKFFVSNNILSSVR